MRNELRIKNENRKEGNLLKEQAIQERFEPIIKATEESTKKITSALSGPGDKPYDFYSKLTKNKDKYYSIYRTDEGNFRLGDSNIQIDDENTIHVGAYSYDYTTGFWDLLMLNKPDDGDYTDEDLLKYTDLVKSVNLINNPREVKGNPRSTLKYKFLERILGIKRKRRRLTSETGGEEGEKIKSDPSGEGIILPGDINGLIQRLRLVCGERAAGNIEATTSEIVAILDELLRQKYITRLEYNAVCKRLGC